MPANPPIGHLPVDHQAARDAAAGPVVGHAAKGQEWPPAYHEPHRAGAGGYWPKGMAFACADCGEIYGTIPLIIRHTLHLHHRPPHDSERVPVT